MDNGDDPPARIPFLKISDKKHDSNKLWPYYHHQKASHLLFAHNIRDPTI